jgi:hypothetical protein
LEPNLNKKPACGAVRAKDAAVACGSPLFSSCLGVVVALFTLFFVATSNILLIAVVPPEKEDASELEEATLEGACARDAEGSSTSGLACTGVWRGV